MKNGLKNILAGAYKKAVLLNNPFYYFGLPKGDYRREGDHVYLNKLNVRAHLQKHHSLIKGYPYAVKIQTALNGKFSIDGDDILLQIEDLRFRINSAEELFILDEVFVSGAYRYACQRKSVFVDIGMNSAITTLLYAKDPMVEKIFSYELFRPTYLLGEKNIKLNEKYSQKIKAFNYGVSNRELQTTIDYSLSRKGRMGLKGLPEDEHFSDIVKEQVFVKDIKDVFEEITGQSEQLDVIVKMDCEGEEFNLIERLSETHLLEKISVLMIEWHYRKPELIEKHLLRFGFHVFTQTLPTLDSGMIYAGKRQ
jgi:FkbM family methyltransferase